MLVFRAFLLTLFLFPTSLLAQYVPPYGIPAPPFGIDEVAPTLPSPWTSPSAGFYYIDEDHPSATDSSNTYGSSTTPRVTIPNSLAAGSVVVIHNDYTRNHSSPNTLLLSGTVGSPIWIIGATGNKVTTGAWEVKGSYAILENIDFDFTASQAGTLTILSAADHISVRGCDVSGTLTGGGVGIATFDSNVSTYIVFYDNEIHDNGNVDPLGGDQDDHGISVGTNQSHIWIVDNLFYLNSGDGVQINGTVASTHHIYVGRNVSHDNKQTGYWTKTAADVIFSQNETYGHVPSDSSGGAGIGFQYDPQRVWFLFNNSHDNTYGFATGSDNTGGRTDIYLLGNIFDNNTAIGVLVNGEVADDYIIAHNTITNNPTRGVENGFGPATPIISSNVIHNGTEFTIGGTPTLRNNVTTQGASVDAGVSETPYADFNTLYGISIQKDYNGISRPQNGIWDAGATEPAVGGSSGETRYPWGLRIK